MEISQRSCWNVGRLVPTRKPDGFPFPSFFRGKLAGINFGSVGCILGYLGCLQKRGTQWPPGVVRGGSCSDSNLSGHGQELLWAKEVVRWRSVTIFHGIGSFTTSMSLGSCLKMWWWSGGRIPDRHVMLCCFFLFLRLCVWFATGWFPTGFEEQRFWNNK